MRLSPKSLATYAVAVALLATPMAACSQTPAPDRDPISFSQLLARERAKADVRISYGSEALQFGELWLPKGAGPHPVVVLVHGGCWRADLPGLELMDYMAADLRARGVAVWNLEYRRIGHPGGGYPGTFTDVSAGVDHLRRIAGEHKLDLQRVVLSGHSAGGHLALWAASRAKLPAASPLRVRDPLPVRGVVTLAGINDLEAYRASGPQACGGPPTIDGLVGAPGARADVYADTSPPRFGEAYATAATARVDRVLVVTLPRAGHFELIDPTAAAWTRIRGVMDAMLAPERRP